ncbi:MAG: hypothetical protein JSV34_04635 [Candidatus Omnitrophota bacterium]|nr:MAG: hypothetical protein JSV34_04635 [Candidatus Omnitrophota bacterium]
MKRKLFLPLLVYLIFNLMMVSNVFACVGARPLAMGGAFVGVADDANATYWNPAGLTQLEDIELTYTPTLYDRDEVNYDDFVSLASPLRFGDQDWGSLGFSFINSGFKTAGSETTDRWYWLSYGAKLPLNLSLGANLRQENYKWKINSGYYIVNTSVVGPIDDSDDALALDLSLLWKWEKLSLGLLWQDVNEPEFDLFDDRVKLICVRNLRPGIAFRPDDKTIISAELYDVTSESEDFDNDLRIGAERWFDLPVEGASLALRVGGYNINTDNEANRAITGGLGCKLGPEVFGQDSDITCSIDYTTMYWPDAVGTEDFTHMVGFKVSIPWDSLVKNTSSTRW